MRYKITISQDISDWKINNRRLAIHARIKEIVNTLLKNMRRRRQIETGYFRSPREFNEAEDGGGVYRSRTGDFCIANAALWPSELIPRIDHRSFACKDIAYFRFGIPRTEEIFFTGKSLLSDPVDTHAGMIRHVACREGRPAPFNGRQTRNFPTFASNCCHESS